MSSIFNVGSSTDSTNSLSSLTSSLFSSSSSSGIGDLAMINSGAYKKLLSAYYKNEASSNAKNTEVDKDEKINLANAKGDADAVSTAAKKLLNTEVTEDNRASLKEDVKNLVEKYNKMIDSGSEVDNSAVLRNTLWMTQSTGKNAGLLSDIGITVGSDNKLSFDEAKFDSANIGTMKTLFSGTDSLIGRIAGKADSVSKIAASAASSGTHASAYTNSGDYDSLSATAIINQLG